MVQILRTVPFDRERTQSIMTMPSVKKIIFLSGLAFVIWFSGPLCSTARARSVELIVHGLECPEGQDGQKVLIRYSVVNNRNFDQPNVSICFKIVIDEKPVACKELKVTVPKGADGSQIYETVLEAPCGKESYKERYDLRATVNHNVPQYRIEEWFAGCPGSWKSGGHDKLNKAVERKDSGKK